MIGSHFAFGASKDVLGVCDSCYRKLRGEWVSEESLHTGNRCQHCGMPPVVVRIRKSA